MKSHLLYASGFFLAVFLLSGCRGDNVSQTEDGRLVLGQAEVEEVVERGVAPGNRTLMLTGTTGNIMLTGTETATANLEFVKRARGADTEDAQALLGDIVIEESGDNQAYRYVMQTEEPERTVVDVRGEVPQNVRLEIQMENGNAELSGIGGPLTIRHANGNVRIGGAAADVQVEVLNGAIEVGYQDLPANGSVNLSVANGNLVLTLPASSSARIDAQTSAGYVNVTGLEFVNRQLSPQGAGNQFTGQLGQGTASIRLRTENGSITIQEGMVERLGTAPAVPADTSVLPGDPAVPPTSTQPEGI
jgi:hypothetical protein